MLCEADEHKQFPEFWFSPNEVLDLRADTVDHLGGDPSISRGIEEVNLRIISQLRIDRSW